jgi:S-adenosylmethionine-diacylgycerolhomoserine-N-methlytransferase
MRNAREGTHADLMDQAYRNQRLIYDLTRKYYLFGRDELLTNLHPGSKAHVLEVACGTGRNLQLASRLYPDCKFYGLDISSEMLATAQKKLDQTARLAQADACSFDGAQCFGQAGFDRIFISYGISMIPDWQQALRQAFEHLAPLGALHVVDFSGLDRWPGWCRGLLYRWLNRFHVTPRLELEEVLDQIAKDRSARVEFRQLYRGYAQLGVLHKTGL